MCSVLRCHNHRQTDRYGLCLVRAGLADSKGEVHEVKGSWAGAPWQAAVARLWGTDTHRPHSENSTKSFKRCSNQTLILPGFLEPQV